MYASDKIYLQQRSLLRGKNTLHRRLLDAFCVPGWSVHEAIDRVQRRHL